MPTDVMGIGPSRTQIAGYQSAYGNFAAGTEWQLANATFAVQAATVTHDALETAIQVGSLAVGAGAVFQGAKIASEAGCAAVAKYCLQQIVKQAENVFASAVISKNVGLLGKWFGADPDTMRIAADSFQLFSLFKMLRAERQAAKATGGVGCFAGTTLVATANHGEQAIADLTDGERVLTSVSETTSGEGKGGEGKGDTQHFS